MDFLVMLEPFYQWIEIIKEWLNVEFTCAKELVHCLLPIL